MSAYISIIICVLTACALIKIMVDALEEHKQEIKDEEREEMREVKTAEIIEEWIEHDRQYHAERMFSEYSKEDKV